MNGLIELLAQVFAAALLAFLVAHLVLKAAHAWRQRKRRKIPC